MFERFLVPSVRETPSPRQTFVRDVALYGSSQSSTEGFVLLASAQLTAHQGRGEFSELNVQRHDAGEARPIAPNDDETGRPMNRRVEINCQG